MDPNETWRDIIDAFQRIENITTGPTRLTIVAVDEVNALTESVVEDLENLALWLKRGGLAPTVGPKLCT